MLPVVSGSNKVCQVKKILFASRSWRLKCQVKVGLLQ